MLGRHGVKKLSMSAIGEAAGVSRATVYNYFPTKGHLIDALNRHEKRRFESALRETALAHAGEPDYLLQVLEFVLRYSQEHVALHQLLETEPAFMLGWLQEAFSSYTELLEEVLQTEFAIVGDALTPDGASTHLAELTLRTALSVYIFPKTDVRALAETLHGLLAAQQRRGVLPTR
jgi:AcrR family transcriptional regulator